MMLFCRFRQTETRVSRHATGGVGDRNHNSVDGHLRSVADRLHVWEQDGCSRVHRWSHCHLVAGDWFRRLVHSRHCYIWHHDIQQPLNIVDNNFQFCLKPAATFSNSKSWQFIQRLWDWKLLLHINQSKISEARWTLQPWRASFHVTFYIWFAHFTVLITAAK